MASHLPKATSIAKTLGTLLWASPAIPTTIPTCTKALVSMMGRPDYTHVDFSPCKTLSHTNTQSGFMTSWKVDTTPFAVEKTKTQGTLSWSDRVWDRPPVSPSGSSSWVELEAKWTTELGQWEIKVLLISIWFPPKILEESELYNLIAPNFGAVSDGRL